MREGESAELQQGPRLMEPIDLKAASIDNAMTHWTKIARLAESEDPEDRQAASEARSDFFHKRATLFEEDHPKAIELLEAQGSDEADKANRESAAYSITRLIAIDPERGLKLGLKLLADKDPTVSSVAADHLLVNHFEESQPVIDGRVVRDLLDYAYDLFSKVRREAKED